MAILVARMVKMKAGNLHGMQRHNQRETEAHSNKDIDNDKSYLNYDLVNEKPINYKDKVNQIIETTRTSKKVVRKDAVLCDEWIITSQQEFFKGANFEDVDNFFKETCNYFKERCGSNNIAYATVHMDETTPHMHLGIVPMFEGRLSSKDVFSRANLLKIQNELPQYLQSCGFENVHRGQKESKRKYLSVPEYKQLQETQHKLKKESVDKIKEIMELKKMSSQLDDDIFRKIEQYNTVKEAVGIFDKKYEYSDWAQENILSVAKEKVGFDKKKKYIFSEEDIEQICKKVNDLSYSSCSNSDLKESNEKLINQNSNLHSSIPDLVNKQTEKLLENNQKLEKDNKMLNTFVKTIVEMKDKASNDCKRIIYDTELYLDKYLNMDELDIEAYKGYLSMDEEINSPKFYELSCTGSEEMVSEAINIYNQIDVNNKIRKKKNIDKDVKQDEIEYTRYDDFELEL